MPSKKMFGVVGGTSILSVLVVVAASYMAWRFLMEENFYPIVSQEVAEYRDKDKRQNLGVLEPDFSPLYRDFAGYKSTRLSE